MSDRAARQRASLIAKSQAMLALQDDMNCRVDPDWLARNREWYRAIWIECAELMDHYGGWKWWKAASPDHAQAMLEIVDIWHFGLSLRIPVDRDYLAAATVLADEWLAGAPSAGFLADVEALACAALVQGRFAVGQVPALLSALDRDFDDLYRAYLGKNVLNFFRQDHGYREGSYRKQWAGREDNVHLVEILAGLDSDSPRFREDIYAQLSLRYATP